MMNLSLILTKNFNNSWSIDEILSFSNSISVYLFLRKNLSEK